ncbi:Protein phosphatase 2C 2 [Irineochytrium annulatum]|nr:Protein phosphatase 2C 2 [Irineochytrium annulatum]
MEDDHAAILDLMNVFPSDHFYDPFAPPTPCTPRFATDIVVTSPQPNTPSPTTSPASPPPPSTPTSIATSYHTTATTQPPNPREAPMTPPPSSPVPNKRLKTSLFAVFDGHGGPHVANYCASNVPECLRKSIRALGGGAGPGSGGSGSGPGGTTNENFLLSGIKTDYPRALANAFNECDLNLLDDDNIPSHKAGTAAVSVLITPDNTLVCANAGDSRAVLCRDGGIAVPLSRDHKPHEPDELRRITSVGGTVENGRVNGVLAVSRAIGDHEFKEGLNVKPSSPGGKVNHDRQVVVSTPDTTSRSIDYGKDEFVVLACDGVWDCMTNEEVVRYIRRCVAFPAVALAGGGTGSGTSTPRRQQSRRGSVDTRGQPPPPPMSPPTLENGNGGIAMPAPASMGSGRKRRSTLKLSAAASTSASFSALDMKWVLGEAAKCVLDRCLADRPVLGGKGCDNMTIVIVALLGGKTFEEWREMIRERVEKEGGGSGGGGGVMKGLWKMLGFRSGS